MRDILMVNLREGDNSDLERISKGLEIFIFGTSLSSNFNEKVLGENTAASPSPIVWTFWRSSVGISESMIHKILFSSLHKEPHFIPALDENGSCLSLIKMLNGRTVCKRSRRNKPQAEERLDNPSGKLILLTALNQNQFFRERQWNTHRGLQPNMNPHLKPTDRDHSRERQKKNGREDKFTRVAACESPAARRPITIVQHQPKKYCSRCGRLKTIRFRCLFFFSLGNHTHAAQCSIPYPHSRTTPAKKRTFSVIQFYFTCLFSVLVALLISGASCGSVLLLCSLSVPFPYSHTHEAIRSFLWAWESEAFECFCCCWAAET